MDINTQVFKHTGINVLACIYLDYHLSVHCSVNYKTKYERLYFAVMSLPIISFLLLTQRQTRKINIFTKLLMAFLYISKGTVAVYLSPALYCKKIFKHFRKLHDEMLV